MGLPNVPGGLGFGFLRTCFGCSPQTPSRDPLNGSLTHFMPAKSKVPLFARGSVRAKKDKPWHEPRSLLENTWQSTDLTSSCSTCLTEARSIAKLWQHALNCCLPEHRQVLSLRQMFMRLQLPELLKRRPGVRSRSGWGSARFPCSCCAR